MITLAFFLGPSFWGLLSGAFFLGPSFWGLLSGAFFLEELSARELLKRLVPRLLVPMERVALCWIVFDGKQDLQRELVGKMRGWRMQDTHFVVLQDQDSADCKDVKSRLVELCDEAKHPEALVRVACREIESWYLGDLVAVEEALNVSGVAKRQNAQKFRNPDSLGSPSRELESLTRGEYQKVSGSRAIASHMRLNDGANCSQSFCAFIDGVRGLVDMALAEA